MLTNFNIEQFLSLDGYVNDVRKNRRKLSVDNKGTQEFFTPYSIVKRMTRWFFIFIYMNYLLHNDL